MDGYAVKRIVRHLTRETSTQYVVRWYSYRYKNGPSSLRNIYLSISWMRTGTGRNDSTPLLVGGNTTVPTLRQTANKVDEPMWLPTDSKKKPLATRSNNCTSYVSTVELQQDHPLFCSLHISRLTDRIKERTAFAIRNRRKLVMSINKLFDDSADVCRNF